MSYHGVVEKQTWPGGTFLPIVFSPWFTMHMLTIILDPTTHILYINSDTPHPNLYFWNSPKSIVVNANSDVTFLNTSNTLPAYRMTQHRLQESLSIQWKQPWHPSLLSGLTVSRTDRGIFLSLADNMRYTVVNVVLQFLLKNKTVTIKVE